MTERNNNITFKVIAGVLLSVILGCGGWFSIEVWASCQEAQTERATTRQELECHKATAKGEMDMIKLRVAVTEIDLKDIKGAVKRVEDEQIIQRFSLEKIREEQKVQMEMTRKILDRMNQLP